MNTWLHSLRIPTKLALISLAFVAPLVVTLVLMAGNLNRTITTATREITGCEYQRPLVDLLDALGRHQLAVQRAAAEQVVPLQGQADRALDALLEVDAQHGEALEFTEAGLARRQRNDARPDLVKRKWSELKTRALTLKPAESVKLHAALVADVRAMIAHSGDTSELTLDPDLDSYYLADVTVAKLPQLQQRLLDALLAMEAAQLRQTNTVAVRAAFATYAAQLQDDLNGLRANVQTALNAEVGGRGSSPTVAAQLPPPVKELADSVEAFIGLCRKAADAPEPPDRELFVAAGLKARGAVLHCWHVAAGELTVMIKRRIAHFRQLRTTQFLIVGGLVGLALLFVRGVARSVTEPLNQAVHLAQCVAQRDLTVRLDGHAGGEIGEINQALNRMVEQLRVNVRAIGLNAQSVSSASQELSAVSTEVSTNSEETAAQGRAVSESATQVSRSVQTVAAATEEMTASISEIARNASQASKVATHAVSVAERANTTVTKLGDSSTEIGNVIKVITGIADQTNLLALNAAIEAARAGELGKGFAVVANEVKELARQTTAATEEITSKINLIQGDAQSAVVAIKEIAGIIKEINDIQTVIAGAVEEQAATTNEISNNTQPAARGSAEIARNVAYVADAARGTMAGACQTAAAAADLARLAVELQKVVDQFRVDHATQPVTFSATPFAQGNGHGHGAGNGFAAVTPRAPALEPPVARN